MGWRFRRRVSFGKLLRLNLSLGGVSVSAGPRGASLTLNPRTGAAAVNVGLPGSGVSYRQRLRAK